MKQTDKSSTSLAPYILVKNITYSIKSKCILSNISITGNKGEIIGLLGPNGAGKTTTLRLLTGNLKPDSGIIQILGIDPCLSRRECAKNLGYLPEGAPVWLDRSVYEILSMASSCHRLNAKNKKHRILEVVNQLNLMNVLNYRCETLSKGLRRRLGLAIALVSDPPVLILDEPSDGLDPLQQLNMQSTLKSLAKNKTIFISTHDLHEVKSICTKIYILHGGKVVGSFEGDEFNNLVKQEKGLIKTYLSLTVEK